MRYLLGIDVGTSSTKAVLYNENLEAVYTANREYELFNPQNGWAEQNPNDWKKACIEIIKEIVNKSNVNVENIKGIGLTGQMHGLVMLDKNNEVIRNAIIWADQRTDKECEEITKMVGKEKLINITANPALPGFTASKILWVRKNEKENYEKCKKILLPKDYIRFVITNEFATDVSDASGMQLLDIAKRDWSDEILKILDIDKTLLAKVYESIEISGYVSLEFEKLTGLKSGIPVIAGAGDNAAAAIGMGVIKENNAFTTIGTSGVVFAPMKNPIIDKKGRVHTFCAATPNMWHVMGVTQAAGLSVSYLRSLLFDKEEKFSEITKNISNIEIGSNKLIYLPYLMGERTPHLDSDARGVFLGMSPLHTKDHYLRAVMEGVSFSLKDCLEIIKEMGIEINEMNLTGGGAKNPIWSQMISDLFDMNVNILNSEGTTLGVAILAGVATGIYSDLDTVIEKYIYKEKIYKAIRENKEQYDKIYLIYKEVYLKLKDIFKDLKNV